MKGHYLSTIFVYLQLDIYLAKGTHSTEQESEFLGLSSPSCTMTGCFYC